MKFQGRDLIEFVGIGVHSQFITLEKELCIGPVYTSLKVGKTVIAIFFVRLIQNLIGDTTLVLKDPLASHGYFHLPIVLDDKKSEEVDRILIQSGVLPNLGGRNRPVIHTQFFHGIPSQHPAGIYELHPQPKF